MTTPCPAPRHGRKADYHRRDQPCRCPEAVEAERLYRKHLKYGHRKVRSGPAAGTMRRLQALACVGWSLDDLVRETGFTRSVLAVLRRGERNFVRRSTRDRIAAVYERLSAPDRVRNEAARRKAFRAGWAAPLLWEGVDIDDPNAQPAADERPAGHKRIDLREVEFFTSLGMTREAAARRMGVQLASIEQAERRAARRANLAQAPTMQRALEHAFADEAGAA